MWIRDTVDIGFVHPVLRAVMQATAIGMGQDITTNTTDPRYWGFL
jgi:hypothetical protein